MTDLAHYIRHAERWGTEHIFETAAEDLEVTDLGRLAHRLQHIDCKWHLDRDERDGLILALQQAGVPPREICNQVGISRPTLRRIVLDHANQGLESAA